MEVKKAIHIFLDLFTIGGCAQSVLIKVTLSRAESVAPFAIVSSIHVCHFTSFSRLSCL